MTDSADTAEETILNWLAATLGGILGVAPEEIDVRQPFSYYGLGSTEAVMIIGDLETWLGCTFPETLAFDHPTIERLAQHVGANLQTYAVHALSAGC